MYIHADGALGYDIEKIFSELNSPPFTDTHAGDWRSSNARIHAHARTHQSGHCELVASDLSSRISGNQTYNFSFSRNWGLVSGTETPTAKTMRGIRGGRG